MTKKAEEPADIAVDESALQRYEEENAASGALSIRSLDDIKRLSTIFIGSGMFKGNKNLDPKTQMYQAGVKMIAGVEFGIQPFAAMRGINIINGNAEMSANLMAAKVKKHPRYDYTVDKWDREGCVLIFWEIPYPGAPRKEWDKLGPSSFDGEDAKAAGLANGDNWKKFARNMYFARAISNGVRIYTPDVFYGAPVYVEGEISGTLDDAPKKAAAQPSKADKAQDAEIVAQDETVQEDPPEEIQDPEFLKNLTERYNQIKLDMNGMDLEDVKKETRELLTDLGYNGKTSLELAKKVTGKATPTTAEDFQKIYAFLDLERDQMVEEAAEEDTAAAFAEENPFIEAPEGEEAAEDETAKE